MASTRFGVNCGRIDQSRLARPAVATVAIRSYPESEDACRIGAVASRANDLYFPERREIGILRDHRGVMAHRGCGDPGVMAT